MVRRAVVIGAGPAGIVGALYLAQMDYDVVVYERRPEPSVAERKSQHSYPMLLASRLGRVGRKQSRHSRLDFFMLYDTQLPRHGANRFTARTSALQPALELPCPGHGSAPLLSSLGTCE